MCLFVCPSSGLPYGTDVRGLSTPPNEKAAKPMNNDLFVAPESMDVSVSLFAYYCKSYPVSMQ